MKRKKPNPFARLLQSKHYAKQVVKPPKGRGSYNRKPKHKEDNEI